MAALTHLESVEALRKEYELTQEVRYSRFSYSRTSSWDLVHKGFTGSAREMFLETDSSIYLSRSSCLAAPEISVVATDRIALGVCTKRSSVKPLRLYVWDHLLLEADCIYVGEVHFLKVPNCIEIRSRRVVFCKIGRESSETFYILNHWIDRERTQVEEVVIS